MSESPEALARRPLNDFADHKDLTPECFMPEQWCDLVGAHGLAAEQRLMLAVLLEAWRSLASPKRQWREDARQWFLSDQTDYLFSLTNVCLALSLDVRHLRRRVLHSHPEKTLAVGGYARGPRTHIKVCA